MVDRWEKEALTSVQAFWYGGGIGEQFITQRTCQACRELRPIDLRRLPRHRYCLSLTRTHAQTRLQEKHNRHLRTHVPHMVHVTKQINKPILDEKPATITKKTAATAEEKQKGFKDRCVIRWRVGSWLWKTGSRKTKEGGVLGVSNVCLCAVRFVLWWWSFFLLLFLISWRLRKQRISRTTQSRVYVWVRERGRERVYICVPTKEMLLW